MKVVALGVELELSEPMYSNIAPSELDASMQLGDGRYGPIPIRMLLNKRTSLIRAGRVHIRASEFVDLSDGSRIGLRNDRGWCHWPPNTSTSPWQTANGREVAKMAYLILDPDDNDDWERWIIQELHKAGIDVDPASVHAAPYRIEFGPRLQEALRQPKP